MTKVIIVSGFARSGKSTLARQLKLNGIHYASSSDVLSVETLKYFGLPVTQPFLDILENKEDELFNRLAETSFTVREAKIHVAEKFIVPNYGRGYFARACLGEMRPSDKIFVVFSTIEDERIQMFRYLDYMGIKKIFKCNLVRGDQQTGVDSRSLFEDPDFTLVNNGLTKKGLFEAFMLGVIAVS